MRLPLLPALLWLCLLHPCTAAPAGPGRYYVRQFTDENGLPQNSVTGLALDELGFVWVATQGGLARFDGQHTFVYDKEKLGTRSSRMIRLTSLAGKNTLYSVDEYFRLIRIKNGKAYRVDNDVKNGVALPALLPLLQDTLSRMKVDTTYTSENYPKYEFIPMGSDRYAVYTDEKIAFLDASGIIGITAFPGTPYFNEFPSEPEHRTTVITSQKQKVCVENFMNVDNVLFYHLHGEGVNFNLISEHEVRPVTLRGDIEKHPAFLKKKSHIRSFRNRIHGQAFAYLEGSLYLIRYSPGTGHLITRLLLDNFDLETSMVVKMLYQESSQTLFLGSIAKGIFVVRQKVFDVVKDQYNSDFHNIFYAHLPFTDSSVLTPEGLVLDRQHRVPVQIRGLAALRPPAERFSMLKDRAGNFWIAKGKQFYCLDAKGNFLQSVTDRGGGFGERKLCRGLGNDIWVGSKTGQIGYIDLAAKDETKNARAIVRINGKIGCLLQTQRGELWIGTSQGLMRYDSLQRRTELIKGLEQMDIRSLYSSNPREIWITTYGDGFFLLSNGRLTRLPADREGFLNQAHCMVEDKFHDFWIPSNKGLFRAHKQDLIDYAAGKITSVFYFYYDKNDGFETNEFNGGCQPCGVTLGNGYISLPSMSGFVWFKPESVRPILAASGFLLENFTVSGKPDPGTDTLLLAYDFGNLSFRIGAPYMRNRYNLEFHYSLQKKSEKQGPWLKAGRDQKVDLYGLSPGTYTLRVRKTSGFGGQYQELRKTLIVKSPWFLSWWFIVPAILVLVGIARLFLKWRLRNLTAQNLQLARKVEERTQHLTKALEDIRTADEALQKQLQIQMRMVWIINHDLHSPLRYLAENTPPFFDRVAGFLPDADTRSYGAAISKSTVKVYKLADNLLKFIKAAYDKKGSVVYEQVEVRQLLKTKAAFFSELAREGQTEITVNCPRGISTYTNRTLLEIIVHNLVDNALKHTYNGKITLTGARDEQQRIVISVSDTGHGIAPEIVAWLNASGTTEGPGSIALPTNLGLGLIIVQEIKNLLGAELAIASDESGTTIRILLHPGAG